ncbi:hypothetical protein NKR23_g1314 [Pleurostoma richardsiae]|uniref:rRNA methyltransferase 1, mitochondrial n=1 Tax=Pleurostoma richardsiae TaxID=41990 RepID=A0AA38SCT1_9PEZI|nr:hypothetical protein NKR23_g1314 [Pleurostoma richardsiae]
MSRFNSEDYRFGKKSLVYQFKKGELEARLQELEGKKPKERISERVNAASGTGRGRRARQPRIASQVQQQQRPNGYGARRDDDLDEAPRERRSRRDDVPERYRTRRNDNAEEAPRKRGPREDQTSGRYRSKRNDNVDDAPRERRPWKDETPVSVPYTTAASQFLYGTSTVEAALRANRRKAYKLYIYSGANRQNVTQDRAIERLAARSGVPIHHIDEGGLRMMDKMSGGRPHNGYILEASPVPQLPVTGLGVVSDAGSNPGYHVSLGHQSQEEAQINGTDDFISLPPRSHKPFVLLLDQVLDPGNVGAILRTASFLGVSAVAISKKNSASLTPVALKASSGASETITLFSVESPAGFLVQSREAGWKVYAGVPASSRSRRRQHMDTVELEESDPLATEPCILLVGSEGEGLSKVLRDKADCEVSIPGHAAASIVDSLNVSVATSLLCSAFLKGQEKVRLKKIKEEDTLFSVLN